MKRRQNSKIHRKKWRGNSMKKVEGKYKNAKKKVAQKFKEKIVRKFKNFWLKMARKLKANTWRENLRIQTKKGHENSKKNC